MVLEESTNIRGWLYKRATLSLNWVKRFFVLQNNILVYYRSLRDNKPRAVYELSDSCNIVDYGVSNGYHQFSIYDNEKRVLWLATEDNKARYWISVLRMEIDKMKSYSQVNDADKGIDNNCVLPPLDCDYKENTFLRDHVESTNIPSCMKTLSSLLHSSSLSTSLISCVNGCLSMTIDSTPAVPYRMMTMSLPIEMEYAAYFLVDCEYARMMWDPFFHHSKEVEKLDNNNSIHHLVFKPLSILQYPCSIKSYPRDFCVYRHFCYDEETNAYIILFSSTTHPLCTSSSTYVRGSLEVGYRVEAVKSGVSRITMIYSVHPGGYLEHHPYFVNQYEEQFKQSLPGLRDMLSQIPEYHILNLIERIIKGSQSIESSDSSTVSGSCDQKSIGPSTSPVEEPEEKLEEKAVTSPYISNSVPHASECETTINCWEEVDGTIWSIRGKDYLKTKEKVRSETNYCKLLCVDVFKSNARINHITEYKECAVHRFDHLKDSVKCVLIINLQIAGNISIVSYFAVPKEDDSTPVQSLLRKFYSNDNTWRDSRFKLLPHIVEGGYLIKKAVGMTPCIVGTKGESSYYTGETPIPFLECDYDMDGSTMARNLSKYLFTAGNMVVELGFVIQGEEEDELPERVLGGFRFYHLDMDKAQFISI